MAIFNLWNIYHLSPDLCQIDVTKGNLPNIQRGTREWITSALTVLEVRVPVLSWEVQATRCFYYSDYPEEESWLDRWPTTWIVTVKLNDKFTTVRNKRSRFPEGLDLPDPTWEYGYEDPMHNTTALIIADFHAERVVVEKAATDIAGRVRSTKIGDGIDTSIRSYGGQTHQLRMLITNIILPAVDPRLKEILELCEERNGVVNWRFSDF